MSTKKIHPKSPLDKARAYEIEDWGLVSPLLKATRRIGNPVYVYFIGEEDGGALKIGLAKDPIKRLRGLQTGNPRRLRIENLLVGDRATEALLHEMWEQFAIHSDGSKAGGAPGTEWFRSEVRPSLMPIVTTAVQAQVHYLVSTDPDHYYLSELEQLVRDAHIEHDHVVRGRDHVYRLSAVSGTTVSRPSRL